MTIEESILDPQPSAQEEEKWAHRINEGFVIDLIALNEITDRYPNLVKMLEEGIIDEH